MTKIDQPKIILITGTSSGFGMHFALRMAKCGHIVYASMRDLSKRLTLENKANECGVQLNFCQLDVTHSDSMDAVIEMILQKHQRVDVVINNAGVALGGFFEDLDIAQIRALMEINFWGTITLNHKIVPIMRKQRSGMIINISSIAGQTASPALSAYNASKWAIEGHSESLYYELKRFGVHVVLVEPGSYPTKIFSDNALIGKRSQDKNSPYCNMFRISFTFDLKFIYK